MKPDAIKNKFLILPHGELDNRGCTTLEIDYWVQQANLMFPNHRKSIAKKWKWFDIKGSEVDKTVAAKNKLKLTFLFASDVEDLSEPRGYDWIRTTLLCIC